MREIIVFAAAALLMCSCGTAAHLPDEGSREDMVNIGYGSVRKEDLTGSVSKVKVESDKVAGYATIYDYLKGRVPGLDISGDTGPGGSPTIRIRGTRSINGPDDPLILVDGFERRDISDLSPSLIESVEVLKDVSVTASYGSRGANGVILITTKRK